MPSLISAFWLRLVVATATTLAPLASIRADEPTPLAYLTPQSFAAVTVRLANAAKSPAAQQYPVEVAAAATKDFLGIPLGAIDRITAMVEPPVGASPQYAIVLEASRPITFDDFRRELTEHTTPGELLGRPLLQSNLAMMPSYCLLDDQTLAVGPKLFLKRLVRGVKPGQSELQELMSTEDARQNHLHAVVTLQPLRSVLEMGIAAAKQQADPEAHPFLDGVLLVDKVILTADLSGTRGASLTAYATSAEAADRIERLIADGYARFREQMINDKEFAEIRNHPEATARAWGDYILRMIDQYAVALGEMRQDDTTFVLAKVEPGSSQSQAMTLATAGVLTALLLPAVQAAREAARRNQSMNNFKQIGLALHNYYDNERSFPAQAIFDASGKPLLSWRVAILPYIEEQALYDKFHLDEPWDSTHNLPLLSEMPTIYLDPSSPGLVVTDGKTHYLAVKGEGTAFTGKPKGTKFADITDGTARTVIMVQVNDANAVEWTKPADYDVAAHAAAPVAGIGSLHPGIFLTAFGDGHVTATPLTITPEAFAAGVSIAGGETTPLP